MLTNVIGFAGTECYDLLLYAAKTLTALGHKVLLADCSDNRSLQSCIPSVEGWDNSFLRYESLDFTMDPDEIPEGYDWVMIDFGKNVKQFSDDCQKMYLVTDYQKQNINWMKECAFPEDMCLYLILRDRVASKVTPEYVAEELADLGLTGILCIADTQDDLESQIMCQYNTRFGFRRVSQSIKDFIIHLIQEHHEPKEIIKAMKLARGEMR